MPPLCIIDLIVIHRNAKIQVFAHNVKPDSQANKRLQQKGWSVVSAAPEGALDHPRSASWAGGQVVVSETVGELLGEIERFVLSVR